MRFWDSSAVVPLLVAEPTTEAAQALLADDPELLVWWGAELECISALARMERDGLLLNPQSNAAFARVDALVGTWHEIQPVDQVRRTARRLLRVHNLRTGEALQLAAAVQGCEGRADSLPIVSLDERFVEAARREGFTVLEPGTH